MRTARAISPSVAPAATAAAHASKRPSPRTLTMLDRHFRTASLSGSSRDVRWEATCCARRLWKGVVSAAGTARGVSVGLAYWLTPTTTAPRSLTALILFAADAG